MVGDGGLSQKSADLASRPVVPLMSFGTSCNDFTAGLKRVTIKMELTIFATPNHCKY